MIWFLPIALMASAIAFLRMPWKRDEKRNNVRWILPRWPTPEQFAKDMPPLTWKTANHHLVNIAVEMVRSDPQWWAKFFCFVICVLGVAAAIRFGVK